MASEHSRQAVNSDTWNIFAEYSEKIKGTAKKTLRFKLKKATGLKPWQSKVGGQPYLPLTETFPCNKNGAALSFLAQINFSEIPLIPDYPNKGIVEFYIDGTDELMGLSSENVTDQSGFRVLYFETIETDESKLHIDIEISSETSENLYLPIEENATFSMVDFVQEDQYMCLWDYRFENTVTPLHGTNFEKLIEEYLEVFSAEGHRIGGYAQIKGEDPRENNDLLRDYELLFQLDSDEDIQWCAAGVGGFFIRPEDLKNCDFSKVEYHWGDW